MDKIRIGSAIKKIEVNDDGECITLPLSDDGFVLGFYRLMEFVQRTAESAAAADVENAAESVEKIVALEEETRRKVDELFGADTCRKVFGGVLPSIDLFVEFFGSLVPFMEEYKDARMKKMDKYAANRTGSAV